MAEWSKYCLKDNPFHIIPAIRINSTDKRINGRIYYSEFAKKEIQQMMEKIEIEEPWIFLATDGTTLGNGKSAFLAHIYWTLKDKGKNVVWAVARDDPRLVNLLSDILDALVTDGKLDQLKESIKKITKTNSITSAELKVCFSKATQRYGYKTLSALTKLLNSEDEKMVYTFSTIKRSIPNSQHAELFGSLLNLVYATTKERFTIFIDQFERYLNAQTSDEQITKLGHQMNELQREMGERTTFIVSTYAEGFNKIKGSSSEGETFTNFDRVSVRLPSMSREDLIAMIITYLKEFRPNHFKGNACYPFEEAVIRYSAERTELNPRSLIIALRLALLYGAIKQYPKIDGQFIKENHQKIFGGFENKWDYFENDKWKHEIR